MAEVGTMLMNERGSLFFQYRATLSPCSFSCSATCRERGQRGGAREGGPGKGRGRGSGRSAVVGGGCCSRQRLGGSCSGPRPMQLSSPASQQPESRPDSSPAPPGCICRQTPCAQTPPAVTWHPGWGCWAPSSSCTACGTMSSTERYSLVRAWRECINSGYTCRPCNGVGS